MNMINDKVHKTVNRTIQDRLQNETITKDENEKKEAQNANVSRDKTPIKNMLQKRNHWREHNTSSY